MNKSDNIHKIKSSDLLLKKTSSNSLLNKLTKKSKKVGDSSAPYNMKIQLESIHYTGINYGYGWTFILSVLNHHWISHRIQIKRGQKSLINKDIYNSIANTTLNNLQHMPITISAQHTSGCKIETILHLKPNFFKKSLKPKSIYTEVENVEQQYQFHEIKKFAQEDVQFMFVLNFEITTKVTH